MRKLLEFLDILAKYDTVLAEHLASSRGNEKYISPKIQNDFIAALAKQTQEAILNEIQEARYFTILLDSTRDISHIDQLSFCFRFVNNKGKVVECFLQYKALDSATAENLFHVLTEQLKVWSIDFNRCRGQAYDGAASMAGRKSGLQARVKEQNSAALYVHCTAHCLNLVLTDACSSCLEAKNFFGNVEKVYVFLTASHPHWITLEKAQDENGIVLKRHLKKLSETCWACHIEAVTALIKMFPAVLQALGEIFERETNSVIAADCNGILQNLSTVEFLLQLLIWEDLLQQLKSLSDYSQSPSMDLAHAANLITSTITVVEQRRSDVNYQKMVNKAQNWAKDMNISPIFSEP